MANLEFKLKPEEIEAALQKNHCSVLRGGVQTWKVGNSVVTTAQYFPTNLGSIAGIALLKINSGLKDLELHYHTAHIIGPITKGKGLIYTGHLESNNNNNLSFLNVEEGNIVIIPKGVPHAFECRWGDELEYISVSIGDELDYQKHHFTSF